ncbi:MAG: HNH endonuclease [Mycobacterium sp.]|uniref:HNH endonuclease signature motif containing protein n=1 Tax=Mycobacterium sp. TaxID=1785 RepID=UPI001ECA9FCB|nr:HNH endonuclease signature motif containing protein [Mycobacterium sp.]MBW0019024.1 HNH endonuclease [Mycobacterium sp.]
MHSSSLEEIAEAFDALRAAMSRVCGLSFEVLTTPERLAYLANLEQQARTLAAPGHALINQLAEQADETALGGRLPHALADRLNITRGEATRRVDEAADLGPRRALTGEVLPPVLTATATAQREGKIGREHVRVIRKFLRKLPGFVDLATREHAHANLAQEATHCRPDELAQLADHVMDCLHPDGDYTDADRARRRGLELGKQDTDGMSRISGWITPELRAGIEALWAKLAAPGMCNPDDQSPIVDGPAPEETARRDLRSRGQRQHDGLNAGVRALLASGKLGQHNGLPATIIVTAELKDLELAAGHGLTAGGTILPMSDVIAMAGHAHHYLTIFDKGKALALYHTRRLASPAQRIVLCAKDRGCSRPRCNVPGYWTEVHHVEPWAKTHHTDINELTLACGADHPLVEPGGWSTRKNTHGETEWIPPPHLDYGQPRTNTFHHPEKMLRADTEDDEDDDP